MFQYLCSSGTFVVLVGGLNRFLCLSCASLPITHNGKFCVNVEHRASLLLCEDKARVGSPSSFVPLAIYFTIKSTFVTFLPD